MRTIFILAILNILFGQGLLAQDSSYKKYSIASTVGTGISMSKPSATPFTVNISGYYNISARWSAGVGTGYSLYDSESLIPLFAVGQYTFRPSARLNPYLDCSIGYAFAPNNNVNGGFLLNPSIGIQYRLWGKQLLFGIGYQLQELERRKTTFNNYFSSEFKEELSFHSLSLKIGVKF